MHTNNTYFYIEEHILYNHLVVSSHDKIYNNQLNLDNITPEHSCHTERSWDSLLSMTSMDDI